MNPEGPCEVVTDKGYHSRNVVSDLADAGVRTYCSEPARGRQKWPGQQRKQQAVYANRRRLRGARGQRLLRQRVGLPTTLPDIGLADMTADMLDRIAARTTAEGETIHNEPFAVQPQMVAEAIRAADALGREWNHKHGLSARG